MLELADIGACLSPLDKRSQEAPYLRVVWVRVPLALPLFSSMNLHPRWSVAADQPLPVDRRFIREMQSFDVFQFGS